MITTSQTANCRKLTQAYVAVAVARRLTEKYVADGSKPDLNSLVKVLDVTWELMDELLRELFDGVENRSGSTSPDFELIM
ncbi:MAG: hypothetical protein C5B55_14815 [Blastocatellia bacterium]|nr:MAG: hypothetical protein C5B55_14815 [Blastocatellia bacterium]